jgi:hypothetical protein
MVPRFDTGAINCHRLLRWSMRDESRDSGENIAERSRLALEAFKKIQSDEPSRNIVLSSEFFLGAGTDVHEFSKIWEGQPVKIIVYLRDYASWLESLYVAQATSGWVARGFDAYYETMESQVSAMPRIRAWSEVVGWENMRIRPLGSDYLFGGDLISDFLEAIGIVDPDFSGKAKRMNTRLPWVVTEFKRMFKQSVQDELLRTGRELRAREKARTNDQGIAMKAMNRLTRPAIGLFERTVQDFEASIPRATYLTEEQTRKLTDLFNADLQSISADTGTDLKPFQPRRDPGVRACVGTMPRDLMQTYSARFLDEEFWLSQDETVQTALGKMLLGYFAGQV